ncbi:MAG: hypothetical protein ACOYS2_03050 [Patescibacteria group bacterium]
MPKKKTSSEFNLKDFFVTFIEDFIKKIGGEIMENIREKAHEIAQEIKRRTTATFFLILGLIFFLVGISLFLENFLPLKGLGYLLTGFIVFLIGFLINIKQK